jgi:hypothetical protein
MTHAAKPPLRLDGLMGVSSQLTAHFAMKTRLISMLCGTALHLSGAVALLYAQGPVSTGTIQDVSRDEGILRLRPTQSGAGPISYYGMDKADILTVGGKPAKLADLTPGMQVSVFYAKQGDRWIVSKVLIPEPTPPQTTTTTATTAAPVVPQTKAATDGDRTTVPARRDANRDGDPTTKGQGSAAIDGDRTTVPADNAKGGGLRRRHP